MKFAVTGGGGYIGSHVVSALQRAGHEVMSVEWRPPGAGDSASNHITMDIFDGDPDLYRRLGSPDVCIHLAWEFGFDHANPAHFSNVVKHHRFIETMLRGGLKHLATAGTVHEIGFHIGPVDETTPAAPRHPYGIAKNYLRQLQDWLCAQHGAVSQWLRCYYITGDDRRSNSIFAKLLKAAEEGQKTFPLNSGELLCDFIDVDELAAQIAKVSSQTAVAGVINCCSGTPTSLKTRVTRFVAENNLDIELQWGKFPMRPYDSPAVWGDVTKLTAALGAAPSERQAEGS